MYLLITFQDILSLVVDLAIWITIIGVICVVVMENKNPEKTIAWMAILIFLPVIGLIIYFFAGQDIRRKRMISRKGYKQLKDRQTEKSDIHELSEVDPLAYHYIRLFYNNDHSTPFYGNEIDVYTTGREKMDALLKDIKAAKHHIHVQYFKIECDKTGNLLADALIEKAKEGVAIRVIYDDVACWRVNPEFYERMKEEGIEVRSFLKVRFPLFTSKINYRNHRKTVVIDGKIGYIGGMNIADRYIDGVEWGIWRDTHIRMHGRGVYGLQTSFLLDWFFVNQSHVSSRDYYPEMEYVGEVTTQIVSSGPTYRWQTIHQGILFAITNARNYIYIQTPYFLPTESIISALEAGALADVDVRLMIPDRSDVAISDYASRSYLKQLMEAGVKVYFYQKGFLHSKTIVWDDYYSTVGSTNMDFRSFEHNFELNAFMYNEKLARKLKQIFIQDQCDSKRIYLKEWNKRPLIHKILESVLRIFSPLL